MTLADWAFNLAEELLVPVGDRWAHTLGVVGQAEVVRNSLPADEREHLVAAAYVHDVGYAPALKRSGLHALDGACYLRSLGHERLAQLVAHHSCARFEAEARGLLAELEAFQPEESAVADALTFCDMTTGPTGAVVEWSERLDEICMRYGQDHLVTVSIRRARPCIEKAITRTEQRLLAADQPVAHPM